MPKVYVETLKRKQIATDEIILIDISTYIYYHMNEEKFKTPICI